MSRSTTVTKQKGRRLIQPVALPETETSVRQVALSDAVVAVEWINRTKGIERKRILDLRGEIERFDKELAKRHELNDAAPTMMKAPLEERRAYTLNVRRLSAMLRKRHARINRTLTRYRFSPGLGVELITKTRQAGLTPFAGKRETRVNINGCELVEADAALALVRLYLIGELHKVHLCDKCGLRWHVAAKSHYKFCSGECREAYYTEAPDYQERRKQIQQTHRDKVKLAKAARAAFTIARKGKGELHHEKS
jgi:hypothetical protein